MKSIGLKRGSVEVIAYDPRWLLLFEQEKQKLLKAFGSSVIEIEHIGSTSVPGLAAKPLIDMMVAIGSLANYRQYIEPLQRLRYEFMPERVFSDRVFLPKGPRKRRTHHLNLVEKDSRQWLQALLFRDYLRAHDDIRHQYQQLKQRLAKEHPDDRAGYTKAKEDFITKVLSVAESLVS